MKRPARLLRVFGAAGLLIGLLAATIGPVTAQQELPSSPGLDGMLFEATDPEFRAGENAIYYPWVANGEDFGLGDSQTSISVQNLEDRDAQIWIYTGNSDGGFDLATTAALSAYAAKTFSADDLEIAEGEGAPVAVLAFHREPAAAIEGIPAGGFLAETTVILSKPEGVEGDFTQVLACVVNVYTADGSFGAPFPFVAAADFQVEFDDSIVFYAQGDLIEWSTQQDLQDFLDAANLGNTGPLVNPFGGVNQDGDCLDAIDNISTPSFLDSVTIGGVAKQAVQGETLPSTSTADTAVSGYNAINGIELAQFDQWYLPIVQTNCGPGGCWDSVIRVANLNNLNSAVTVRFFPADDGSGSLQTGFQVQESVDGGETVSLNLSDLVPEGWVGSAHILSDGAVFTMVDRYKVGYNMWLTNTGSSADFENLAQVDNAQGDYVLFAPHVLVDYFGWNTGINVANLADEDNNVSIQYFNLLGNATEGLNQRLAPHGMTYFYDPSQAPQDDSEQDPVTDVNAGIVGSALIWSDEPVAAVVDATKYPESDPDGGVDLFQGTSYSATQNVFTWQAVPLVQKGDPADGMGATSGINIMNPNPTPATANVYFVNPSGFNASNFGTSSVTIPGFANGFVYTLTQRNLPNGFTGAAQVISNIPVSAVSANVDYQVDGDGSAIFNAFNPCGFFRVAGDGDEDDDDNGSCTFGDPFDTSGRSVTKTFLDEDGEPVAGVNFSIVGDNPAFPFQRDGVSGTDGSATFTNVPVGTYDLFVNSVPEYVEAPDPLESQETFTVTQGADVSLTNEFLFDQEWSLTMCVSAFLEDFTQEPFCSDRTLADINVRVYEIVGTSSDGSPVRGDIVYEEVTGPEGTAGSRLAPGDYLVCYYDANESATVTQTGEPVRPYLPVEPYFSDPLSTPSFEVAGFLCGQRDVFGVPFYGVEFTLDVDETELLEAPTFIYDGIMNIFVWEQGDTAGLSLQQEPGRTPLAGVEICIDQGVWDLGFPVLDPEFANDSLISLGCQVSDANGLVEFEIAFDYPYFNRTIFGDPDDTFTTAGGAELYVPQYYGDPATLDTPKSVFFTNQLEMYVDFEGYEVFCLEGGLLTTSAPDADFPGVSDPTFEDDLALPCNGGIVPNLEQLFFVEYNPTWDLVQDSWIQDINAAGELRGSASFDLQIEMAPLP